MDSLLINLSNSPLFNGSIMLLSNIGGKYLALDLPKNIDVLFENYAILRYIILFSIFFIATRDIKISVLLTLFYFIFIKFLLNENSRFCLLKENKNDKK
tara:strand:+ start:119 stop:415 length:297 start_codon:yes stop_codon:yes gene_type:complete